METVKEIQKKYCSWAMGAAIVTSLLLIIVGHKDLGKGLVLGTIFSVLNFILMAEAIPLRLGKSRGKTYSWSLVTVCFRYVLLAIPLVVAIKMEQIHLLSTVIGIFMIQLVILVDNFFHLTSSTRKS